MDEFSYHQPQKGIFIAKGLISIILGEGGSFGIAYSPSWFFLSRRYSFSPEAFEVMNWGWNCSTAHLCVSWAPPVQHFGHEMVICPSGWRADFSTCMCVSLPYKNLNGPSEIWCSELQDLTLTVEFKLHSDLLVGSFISRIYHLDVSPFQSSYCVIPL